MRCSGPTTRRSCGSLIFILPILLLPFTCTTFFAVCSQPGRTNIKRPSFDRASFSRSPSLQDPNHRIKDPSSSRSALSSAFSSASSSGDTDVHMLNTSPFLGVPFSTSSAPSSPLSAATAEDPLPPGAPPPPPPALTPDKPSPTSPLSYSTSVAPVHVSTAAFPLSRSTEQLAPILRGVCNIPAFNPCVAIAECVPSVPVIGEATCICPSGYVGDGFVSGQGCNDINECTTGQNDCDPRTMVCIDAPGSFRCECLRGFSMAPNGKTCLDIDECQNPALNECDPLTMTCHNLEGTYKCVCNNPQQIMDEVTKKCRDLNECEDLQGIMNPCEQLCEDRIGGFRCSCRDGYQLAPNGVSCLDIDECADPLLNACDPAGVISRCENVVGGYRCICNEALGFANGPDGVACVNLDECVRDPYICGGALSCCKDLFPPQRFACTVPVDDVLGHTPPLGGITAYGINAALGGSSLTKWIPGLLGVDSARMLALPTGLWEKDVPLPLTGYGNAAESKAMKDAVQGLGRGEEERKWREVVVTGKGDENTKGGAQHGSQKIEARGQNVERVQTVKGKWTTSDVNITRDSENRASGEAAEMARQVMKDKNHTDAELIREPELKREGANGERVEEGERQTVDANKRNSEWRPVERQLHREEEQDAVGGGQRNPFSTYMILSGPEQVGAVYSREEARGTETNKQNSGIVDSERKQGRCHPDTARPLKEKNSEFPAAGGGRQGKELALEKEQPSYVEAHALEARSPYEGETVVIAGNASPEEIQEKLRRIARRSAALLGAEDRASLSRRRLQLLTAFKPGSSYLPGSQLGPIGGIRFGRGATCPAGFRLGGDLYREKVRTKMKNTFEYLITSNIQTNPDGSRRIVSPQEVAAGVLSNAHLVSDEATKWYNEFVKLPSAIAPALHIGTSAAMDVGRQAALQQLLNA